MPRHSILGCALAIAACATARNAPSGSSGDSPGTGTEAAGFSVDAKWPRQLPNDWILGQVSGIAVDADDHVWVLQRPGSLTEDEKALTFHPPPSKCCAPAPPVLEFDGEGRLLRSWGGPGKGYDWPQNEHGIHVDGKGFVWGSGNGDNGGQIVRFTRDGKCESHAGGEGWRGGGGQGEKGGAGPPFPRGGRFVGGGWKRRPGDKRRGGRGPGGPRGMGAEPPRKRIVRRRGVPEPPHHRLRRG